MLLHKSLRFSVALALLLKVDSSRTKTSLHSSHDAAASVDGAALETEGKLDYSEKEGPAVSHTRKEEANQARKLAEQWSPVWGNLYKDGYCSKDVEPINGIPTYATKEECCKTWFGQQGPDGKCSTTATAPTTTVATTAATPTTTTTTTVYVDRSLNEDCNNTQVDGVDWVQPSVSFFRGSSFAGKTCVELMGLVSDSDPEGRSDLCNFLSSGINGLTAKTACCFCGGGGDGSSSGSGSSSGGGGNCVNLDFNDVQEGEDALDCTFIDEKIQDKESFCSEFGNDSFSIEGLTIAEACCACGGGDTSGSVQRRERRRMQQLPTLGTATQQDIVLEYKINPLLGDSPGIPNLEYLGLGYDFIKGNPRGSETSELDPGFKYRAIMLINEQSSLTNDQDFMVPKGTAVKYVSSCKYDSSSTQVTSDTEMRNSLEKEASFSTSNSVSLSASASKMGFGASLDASASWAFSGSEKFQKNSEESSSERSVSFESKAICMEYEASFAPTDDYKPLLHPDFAKALENLPTGSYVPTSHRKDWEKFFNRYGTSYVSYVILGGKRIQTTSMSQQDFASLVSQSVDVESTMSYEVSVALSASISNKKALTEEANQRQAAKDASKGTGNPTGTGNNYFIVNNEGCDEEEGIDETKLWEAEVTAKYDRAHSEFASNRQQAEQIRKISKVKTKHTEYTLGGLPSQDWREWAATVREKPMPVTYRISSYSEFMSGTQQIAFMDAIQDIYGIDLSQRSKEPFLKDQVHHGVFTGKGHPLARNALDPNNENRVLMQVDEITKLSAGGDKVEDSATIEREVFDHGSGDYYKYINPNAAEAACGIKITYQPNKSPSGSDCDADDMVGIYDIQFRQCNVVEQVSDDQYVSIASVPPNFVDDVVRKGDENECPPTSQTEQCDEGQVLCGLEIAYCGLDTNDGHCEHYFANTDDDMGIYHIKAFCKTLGGPCDNKILEFCETRDGEGCKTVTDDDDDRWVLNTGFEEPLTEYKIKLGQGGVRPNNEATDYVIAGASTKFGQSDDDKLGISALKLHLRAVPLTSGGKKPPASIVTYSGVWRGKTKKPAAQFATPIRQMIAPGYEERVEFGFRTKYFKQYFGGWEDNVYFTITKDINSEGSLALTNFGELDLDVTGNSRLSMFSYLTVDNLKRYGEEFISGIVASSGLLLDHAGKKDVSIIKAGYRTFEVTYKDKNYTERPTVIVFPNWFSDDGEFYPQTIGDLSYAVRTSYKDSFIVSHGLPSGDVSNFGFNFLVISEKMPTDNVKHGIVVECTSGKIDGVTQVLNGIEVNSDDCSDKIQWQGIDKPYNIEHKGVEVKFTNPFDDTPTVIVSPYWLTDEDHIVRCIVESITVEAAVVKCGKIRELQEKPKIDYTPVPFTFVAVGEKMKSEDTVSSPF